MNSDFKETCHDKTGHFYIEVRDDSMHLTIIEKNDESNITFNSVKELLSKMNAIGIDEKAIADTIANKNKDAIVAKVEKQRVDLFIEDNDMKALVAVSGSGKYKSLVKEDVLQELTKTGVIFGIDEDAIEKAINNPGNKYIVAIGKKPVDGTDAQIKFKKDVTGERGKPKEIEGGRVDFKDLDLFLGVNENEVIAEKILATAGEDGSTVKGRLLKAIAGRDKRIKVGKNVIVEENIYTAKIAGHLQVTNDKVEVLPVLQLKSDVDLSTGNIIFPGDINIKGSVQAGFLVKAEGKVVIEGSIQGGSVEGSIVEVKHGIQGAPDSYVQAQEMLSAKFIENAVVSSAGNIVVTDSILHSKVSAGKRLSMTGSKAIIAGGRISAGVEIDAKNVGTQMAPPTVLEVGVNPTLKEEYVKLKEAYKETTIKQESIKKSLILIKPDEKSEVIESRQELYTKLIKANFTLLGEIETMKNRLFYIEEEFSNLSDGKVKCNGSIFPGVKLVINNIVYPVRDILQFAVFFVEDGEIRFSTYS